jgi:hypothetical protein
MTAASYSGRSRVESRVETFMTKITMAAFSVTSKESLQTEAILESRNDATLYLLS